MDNDDATVGRIHSRRELLSLFGAAGAALIAGACSSGSGPPAAPASPAAGGDAAPAAAAASPAPTADGANQAATATPTVGTPATRALSCVVTPELTEGPYFVDEKLNRSDITTDTGTKASVAGTPLVLNVGVFQASASQCIPLANAQVDVWHCDARGVYSDVNDPGFSSKGKNFLRGYQDTDATGQAKFTTVYPGWYQGRATHIHFKVRAQKDGKNYEFTSQWFFDEALNDAVYRLPAYAKTGNRTLNTADGIYRSSGGQTLVKLNKSGAGYEGSFLIGMNV